MRTLALGTAMLVATLTCAASGVASAQDSALDRSLSDLTARLLQSTRLTRGSKLAIMSPVDSLGRESGWGRLVADKLTTRLFAAGDFELVERSLLASAIRELRLQGVGITDQRTAQRLGRLVNGEAILIGSYYDLGSTRNLNIRIISVSRGTVLAAAGTELPLADRTASVPPAVSGLGEQARQAVRSGQACLQVPAGVQVDANGCPADSDRDGVPDYMDRCPSTPYGATVDANGCPRDSDADGVPDYRDKCPNTPRGVQVDENGCAGSRQMGTTTGNEWSNSSISVRGVGAERRGRDTYVTFVITNLTVSSTSVHFYMENVQDQAVDYLSDDLGNRYRVVAGNMFPTWVARGGYAQQDVTLAPGVPTRFQFVFEGVVPGASTVTLVLPWGATSNFQPTTITLGPMPLR